MNPDLKRLRWRETRLRLDALTLAVRFQPREELNEGTIAKYKVAMRRGDSFPPVSVARVGSSLYVVDGFHRVAAAAEAGLKEIDARVAPMGEAVAVAYAIEANATHGLPLSRKDKRRCFTMYVEVGNHLRSDGSVKSLREIRRDLGNIAWPTTISKWLREAEVEPSDDDDGPVVSWANESEALADGTNALEVRSLLEMAEDLYQGLDDPDDRRSIRLSIRGLLGRLESGEGDLEI